MNIDNFRITFRELTDHDPFPWQEKLYRRLVDEKNDFPDQCSIPTGLGKTAVIPVWLIALTHNAANVPRRLVYVVNRRTVVDQSTAEAENIRKLLSKDCCPEELTPLREKLLELAGEPDGDPLAISTLRGQFADNGEWCANPARPAVIVGTVDMIGSRLLFSGYGCGRAKKAQHAGFLGQNVLLVHDEAHLEPAFQTLLVDLFAEQKRCGDRWPLHVMELTATSRSLGDLQKDKSENKVLALSDADRKTSIVKERLEAPKHISFHSIDDEKKKTAAAEVDFALDVARQHADSAILIYARKVKDVLGIVNGLKKAKIADSQIAQLTGTMRGWERDQMAAKNPVFARFQPKPHIEGQSGTVFMVCTSAGEVGVDISADHLVCDLTPFDSMAQRFGRVNRFGKCDNTEIHVVHPEKFDDAKPNEVKRQKTLELLNDEILNGSVNSAALEKLDPTARAEAFSPIPALLPATDILFDAWAMTTIREKMPGRPPVEPYLHGIAEWEPPETHVAWRKEVDIKDLGQDKEKAQQILDVYPLKPHELLRDQTSRITEELEKLIKRLGNTDQNIFAWVIDNDGDVQVIPLLKLLEKNKQKKPIVKLDGCIVVLPPSAGGLNPGGMLDGASTSAPDVADQWADKEGLLRKRCLHDEDLPVNMVCELEIPIFDSEDEDAGPKIIYRWFVRKPESPNERARKACTLDDHVNGVTNAIQPSLTTLKLPEDISRAVMLAARFHDLGKSRVRWQQWIGNTWYPDKDSEVYAKSGRIDENNRILQRRYYRLDYRHEFGSLSDIEKEADFQRLDEDMKDLTLHLIAAHHGRARPHFPSDEAYDPESSSGEWDKLAQEVPRRYARLQRKYGRWGLAYLESLLRAADWAASAEPSRYADTQEHSKEAEEVQS